ncbi:hypothetical protein DACRYDRAFT_18799 [Dacryopinax primogenitus]|uniref:Uncharacterized protein n=1 Tax=Dacryopinax primogenitus (strain DJM 731) TaxID=1858805 RepID=M5FR91_DACPD|nr:uncharacterized protein DACRYDRAFT_18799 [Dacryopinax primogenitus]EJT97434.1 hypothetical protein DACRYDRAFT_18799 [Dacryopinax primogenitus]
MELQNETSAGEEFGTIQAPLSSEDTLLSGLDQPEALSSVSSSRGGSNEEGSGYEFMMEGLSLRVFDPSLGERRGIGSETAPSAAGYLTVDITPLASIAPSAGVFFPYVFLRSSRSPPSSSPHAFEAFASDKYGAYEVGTAIIPVTSCTGSATAYHQVPGTRYRRIGTLADLIHPHEETNNTPMTPALVHDHGYAKFLEDLHQAAEERDVGRMPRPMDLAYIIYLVNCSGGHGDDQSALSASGIEITSALVAPRDCGSNGSETTNTVVDDDLMQMLAEGVTSSPPSEQHGTGPQQPEQHDTSPSSDSELRSSTMVTSRNTHVQRRGVVSVGLSTRRIKGSRGRPGQTARALQETERFIAIASYLQNLFPTLSTKLAGSGGGLAGGDSAWLFKTRTEAFLNVCEVLEMRADDLHIGIDQATSRSVSVGCDVVAGWFASFPKAKSLNRATLTNHRGILNRWGALWADSESDYEVNKDILNTPRDQMVYRHPPRKPRGPEGVKFLSVEILGLIGYLFAPDETDRRRLLPSALEENFFQKLSKRLAWGTVESEIAVYFPDYAPRRRVAISKT